MGWDGVGRTLKLIKTHLAAAPAVGRDTFIDEVARSIQQRFSRRY